jgi:hypothetical protein
MISSTLNQYKKSFKSQLLAFLNEYEDNTKFFFLQNEKIKYQSYQKALTKIADQIKFFTLEELNQNIVHRSIAADLKSIDQNIYNSIITELNPIQDETILSLSAAKKDRIKIDETALEKHIKSSIIILKFITDQNNIPNDISKPTYTDESEETVLKQNTKEQLDIELDKWLKNYEANFEYLPIPLIIEEKADYVTDTYRNYEERNFNFQIDVCNTILNNVPGDNLIIGIKKKYIKQLQLLRTQNPIPDTKIEIIISEINNALYRLEKFMDGTVLNYKSFLFNDAFTIFFNELNKLENVNVKNHQLRDGYHYYLSQLYYAYDKCEFKNTDAYKNEDFNRDCNELFYVNEYRYSEFGISSDLDDNKFEMPSIMEIVNDSISEFDEKFDKGFESKEILQKHIIETSIEIDKEKTHLYKVIIDILKHPSDILVQDDDEAYLGLDKNGIEMYKETGSRDKYDEIKNIKEPFSNLESLTIELMNDTKHQKILDGYLKLIFKEFTGIAVIIIDYYNDYINDSAKKSKNYPKDLEYFFYTYKSSLEKYYEFIIEFLDDGFLKIENKIFLDDTGYYIKNDLNNIDNYKIEPKSQLESVEENNVLKSTIDDYLEQFKEEINGDGYEKLVNALYEYFTNNKFPILENKINFKRINKKRLGWALKELYKSEKTDKLNIEYFRFAQENINLFAKEVIVTEGFLQSNFYKVFTTNPVK